MAPERRIPIRSDVDAKEATSWACRYARQIGFPGPPSDEIGLAVRELSLNVLHHGGEGVLTLRPLNEEGREGIEVEAVNPGPPIRDVEEAFRDGFSTRGSFGYGLGTVNRMMHDVEVESPRADGSGTRIVTRRWLYTDSAPAAAFLQTGVASRSSPGFEENGDAVLLTSWADRSLVAVIDGLGHGRPAMRASRAARSYVLRHARESLEGIFRGVDRACRGTRGVVMALVRFCWSEGTVTVGNVGNVEIRVFGTDERVGFVVRRGFLGRAAPAAAVRTTSWPAAATMVLHTDGIRGTSLSRHYEAVAERSPQQVATTLLHHLARERDDATVVVLRRRNG